MNSMKLVIPLHSMFWSIHTKDESKRGTAFAFIFGVNWLWRCGVTASFGVFFHEIKCNRWQVSWKSCQVSSMCHIMQSYINFFSLFSFVGLLKKLGPWVTLRGVWRLFATKWGFVCLMTPGHKLTSNSNDTFSWKSLISGQESLRLRELFVC